MTQYASFDRTQSDPKPVNGWYDTDLVHYPNLPSSDSMLELTADQWTAHMTNPSGWAISGGQLIAHTPPLTPAQHANKVLSDGIEITGAISGTYSINAMSQAKITAMLHYIITHGTFYGGRTDYPWVDKAGVAHSFTIAQFQAFAEHVTNRIAELDMFAATGDGTLPTGPVTIP